MGDDDAIVLPASGAPSAALVRAVERAADYGRTTKASSTEVAYAADWRRFSEWVSPMGASPLPAAPELVAAHLAWLADEGCKVSTIERALAAIGHFHKRAGADWYRGHPAVVNVLEGIRRKKGGAVVKKTALEIDLLLQAVETLGRADGVDERHLQMDRTLLVVGFWATLRSANLVAIERAHVQFKPEGVVIHLPKSKTDQRKKGRDVGIYEQPVASVCPTANLRTYIAMRGDGPGILFPVSRRYVAQLVKRAVANPDHKHAGIRAVEACTECAERAKTFSSHSLRHGFATTAAHRGKSEESIMRHGGWETERVVRGYVQRATPFENNPTKDLLK
jgi:site-specific recombinase XerD